VYVCAFVLLRTVVGGVANSKVLPYGVMFDIAFVITLATNKASAKLTETV